MRRGPLVFCFCGPLGGAGPFEKTKSGGGNVKILLPETEVQGLAGSGEQREEATGRAEGRNPAAEM